MADEGAQGREDGSWWASKAKADAPRASLAFDEPRWPEASQPPLAFDEPLVWPEALHWEHPPGNGVASPTDPSSGVEGDEVPFAYPVSEVNVERPPGLEGQPIGDAEPLAGLGGGTAIPTAAPGATLPPPSHTLDDGPPTLMVAGVWPDGDRPPGDALQLESMWADEAQPVGGNLLVTSTIAAPAVSVKADGSSGGRPWRRLKVRPGNAAVVALISVASLILLGMFLSVRARNDVPTDALRTRPPSTAISVPTLRTVPPITVVTTTVPPPSINLSDLLPAPGTSVTPDAGAAGPTAGTGAAAARPAGADGGVGAGATATTATTRPPAPSAGAGPATTQPAPPTPATTTAPEPEPTTTTPPVEDTRPTVTTRPPVPTTQFTIPDIPVPTISSTPPRTIPRLFPNRD